MKQKWKGRESRKEGVAGEAWSEDSAKMQGEGAEGHNPKRKVIWVESEETQDHVSQSSGLSVEEEEELGWVPSAISIAQRPICKCDNHCSDKALGYWQSAEVLVDDGEEVRTRNLCQQCYNEERKEQGEQPLKSWEWRALVEQTAQRRKLWRNSGSARTLREMWVYLSAERTKAKQIMKEAVFGASAAGTSCHGSPESGQKLCRYQLHSKDYETGASCSAKRRMGRIQKMAQKG